MRYYLDEDLSPRIAVLLRAVGLDALSSHECGRNGLDDRTQLGLAALEERSFVTANRDDFIRLTVELFEEQAPHAGVLVIPFSLPGRDFARISRALEDYAAKHPQGMQPYTIDFLSE